MKRWLARELAKNDKSLVGFWPLHSNGLDYSGYNNHTLRDNSFISRGKQNHLNTSTESHSVGPLGQQSPIYFNTHNAISISSWFCVNTFNSPDNTINSIAPFNQFNDLFSILGVTINTPDNPIQIYVYLTIVNGERGIGFSIRFYDDTSGHTYAYYVFAPYNIVIGENYHVIATYSGNTGTSQDMQIYINGKPMGLLLLLSDISIFHSYYDSYRFKYFLYFSLGNFSGVDNTNNSPGSIGIARVWHNRLINPTEVAKIYNQELNIFLPRKKYKQINKKGFCNLFIGGQVMKKTLPLFIDGPAPPTGQINFFVDGSAPISTGIYLYIDGNGTSPSGINLYIHGGDRGTGTFPMYIHGQKLIDAGMNLFVNNPTIKLPGPQLPFYLTGSASNARGGIQKNFTMSISGTGNHTGMNLYVAGPRSAPLSAHMNLFTVAQPQHISKGVSLSVQNNQSGMNTSVPMNINGGGNILVPNAANVSGGMNLFLKRWPSNAMPMFICSASPVHTPVNLYVNGTAAKNNNLAFALPQVTGSGTKNVPLFISGW